MRRKERRRGRHFLARSPSWSRLSRHRHDFHIAAYLSQQAIIDSPSTPSYRISRIDPQQVQGIHNPPYTLHFHLITTTFELTALPSIHHSSSFPPYITRPGRCMESIELYIYINNDGTRNIYPFIHHLFPCPCCTN